ncbi:hypothetical protein CC2G_012010 [Coprinopsis cinerea AmutBmut pab1-1]|nr:hypothetical protein CC2G_012010 [Coprinopsis cinerea AmutBmut pab1-1]
MPSPDLLVKPQTLSSLFLFPLAFDSSTETSKMSGQCSICLNDYRDPISIPCGHVYCFACLNQYANGPTHEGLKAACPTCRQEFHYVTPDVRDLPPHPMGGNSHPSL